ncbi:TetR family transcriptional regulator [Bifidobacterium pullorum]|uniref:TetR/AcrR family transcriptional regulator n=1 Tax=Bifidobacterium pullorum TaxID=78448 RepID=UPI0025A3D27F|nr:TetR family transcriptional regulator [Bifidobacterium pullorum]MDM8322576.1 TetR family transcriptional regulator [Bifidobacterium pullorum]
MRHQDTPTNDDQATIPATGRDATTPVRRTRRVDPNRRQRIIDACLDVIAERGVAGTSHRVVAEAADVPLGSMTYHFDGFDDLIFQAFSHYAQQAAERFRIRMEQARTRNDACEAIAETIADDLLGTHRDMVINLELYAIAARKPRFRDIMTEWTRTVLTSMAPFFDPQTAKLLDDVIEGITIHRAMAVPHPSVERTRQDARDAIARILTGAV